ncbi:hypothetical protein [Pseudobdellovibrio sp. HCB154]|uniref:hypothetical protein n=1 Tax=Pseudobdellovibrio sp. HCB154 TaxID=3386277 RepID=UPI003916F019
MKLHAYALTLALAFSTVTANAAAGDLVCTREYARLTTRIEINTQGDFHFREEYKGAFPTVSESSGRAEGSLENTDNGIQAEFTFVAFAVPSKLSVTNSSGELTLGDSSPMTGLICELAQ